MVKTDSKFPHFRIAITNAYTPLAHSSLSTTYGYIYNPLTEEESYNALARALSTNPDPVEQDTSNVVDFVSKLHNQDLSPNVAKMSGKIKERKHR